MNIKPLGDRIVVQIEEVEDSKYKTTSFGIVVAQEDIKNSRHKEGKVVAVGPGRMSEMSPAIGSATGMTMFTYAPMSIKLGDTVVFDFGPEYTIGGKKYYILKETDVLAILTE